MFLKIYQFYIFVHNGKCNGHKFTEMYFSDQRRFECLRKTMFMLINFYELMSQNTINLNEDAYYEVWFSLGCFAQF